LDSADNEPLSKKTGDMVIAEERRSPERVLVVGIERPNPDA
jgi:hypothetical protein